MKIMKKRGKTPKEIRPIVVDDYIYNDPEDSGPADSVSSDTPDEAIRKLRGRSAKEPPESSEAKEKDEKETASSRVFSSGIMLDENLQPVETAERRSRRKHRRLRTTALTTAAVILILGLGAFIFQRTSGAPLFGSEDSLVSRLISPVQSVFAGIADSFGGFFREWKLRENLQAELDRVTAENEVLTYETMLTEELQVKSRMYADLKEEADANPLLRPLIARITDKSSPTYYSTFTINKGSADGIKPYMPVTYDYSLVGYTETVQEHESVVRTIIDSTASIGVVIQSINDDQGTLRGTLGLDDVSGPPMCRVYYIPESSLPRLLDPVLTSGVGMDFQEGIPVGEIAESSRGSIENKEYILVRPNVDFPHLEYVIVLRFVPSRNPVISQAASRPDWELSTLEPSYVPPEVPVVAASLFDTPSPEPTDTPAPTEIPEYWVPTATPTEEPTPTPTLTPTPEPTPTPKATPYVSQIPYHIGKRRNEEPTPTPSPTPAPTPTPYYTPDPDMMDWEEDE